MSASNRSVLPEILDDLDANDPRARRSRRDLQRVHAAMRSVSILKRALEKPGLATHPPHRILELGAGDGTLLLRLARALNPRWRDVELTLLDRLDLVSSQTRAAYLELGWRVTVLRADALEWAARPPGQHYDLCLANLFLHHFAAAPLGVLLRGAASGSPSFIKAAAASTGTAG